MTDRSLNICRSSGAISGYSRRTRRPRCAAGGVYFAADELDQSARKLPGLTFDFYSGAKASNFYELAVLWNNPNGSAIVGHFAVNRATGDVWKLVLCTRVESAALRRLQQTLRERIGLGLEELHKLESEAPCWLSAVKRLLYSASAREVVLSSCGKPPIPS